MRTEQGSFAPDDVAWILDLLSQGAGSRVTWAPAGQLPAGYDVADQLALLPAAGGRTFVVSLGSRRGSGAALTAYNALRPLRKRLGRAALGTGLRTGMAAPFVRRRIDIGIADSLTPDERAECLLTEHLGSLLGSDRVVVAFGGGTGPYRKPVLQVFASNGTPLAYVKVGWNEWTRQAVRREAAALRACADRTLQLGVPAVIAQSDWNGLEVLVTAPLPAAVRHIGSEPALPAVSILREINSLSGVSRGELAASAWWRELRQRIEVAVVDQAMKERMLALANDVERAHGGAVLEFGTWHGDFSPWNLARAGARLYAWDWECSTPGVPVGFDALHFFFQIAFVGKALPLEEAVTAATYGADVALRELGLRADERRLLDSLHLLEISVRHEEARSSTGDVDDRFARELGPVLQRFIDVEAAVCPTGTRRSA